MCAVASPAADAYSRDGQTKVLSGGLSGSDSLLAYEALPMSALRSGYRVIRLRSPTGSHLQFGSLLVCLRSLNSTPLTIAAVCP